MADYYMFNVRLWVVGQTVDPKLYYYADADKTLTLVLLDGNGEVVKDEVGNDVSMTYNAVQGINEIILGDWLSAVNKTWAEGIYILLIDNGTHQLYAPIIVVGASQGIPVTETDKINKIIVHDTVTGIMIELPPTTTQIPASDRFRTLIYQHNNSTKLGRLVSILGTDIEFDTKWIRTAIIELTLRFNDLQSMANYLAKLGYVATPDKEVAEAIGKLLNTNPSKVVSILGLYGILPVMNSRVLVYDIDPDNYEIRTRLLIRLGWGWEDLERAVAYAIAGAAIAGGVIAGAAITGVTLGTGAAVGIVVAGAAIGFGLGLIAGESNDSSTGGGSDTADLKDNINANYTIGRKKIEDIYSKTTNDLDALHEAGEITDHAYEILKQDIENLYNTSVKALEELRDEAVKSIDEAYERGKKAMLPWTIGAGIGGAVLGYIAGKR